jgi:hypothetical protein
MNQYLTSEKQSQPKNKLAIQSNYQTENTYELKSNNLKTV